MDLCMVAGHMESNLRDRKPRSYDHLYRPEHMLARFEQLMGELFMTEQNASKEGLKILRKEQGRCSCSQDAAAGLPECDQAS